MTRILFLLLTWSICLHVPRLTCCHVQITSFLVFFIWVLWPFKTQDCFTHFQQSGWLDSLGLYVLFNSISVISRWWKGEHEGLCAMKGHLDSERTLWVSNQRPHDPKCEGSGWKKGDQSPVKLTWPPTNRTLVSHVTQVMYVWGRRGGGRVCKT